MKNVFIFIGSLFVLLFLLFISQISYSQNYFPVTKGSKLEFRMESDYKVVNVNFSNCTGKIAFVPEKLTAASIDIKFKVASLKTINAALDKKLKSIGYFNESKYPYIIIKSTGIDKDTPNGIVYKMNGTIVVNNIEKPIIIPFTATKTEIGYLFRGSFTLKTEEFYLGLNNDMGKELDFFFEIRTQQNK